MLSTEITCLFLHFRISIYDNEKARNAQMSRHCCVELIYDLTPYLIIIKSN